MSELKERIKGRLGDLLPLKYGKNLPAAVRDSTGSVPVYGSSGVVGNHSAALTSGPAIIVGRKGNVGAVHYSAVPCWPIDTAYFAEAPMGHDPRYYRYLLSSLGLARLDKSTAIPGLSRDDYNAVEVTIHPPEQQAEVVAEIEKQFSRLDEAVANLYRVKANLKRYKASVLKAAVEGRLVETEASIAQREGRSYETGEQLLQRIAECRQQQWIGRGKYKEAQTNWTGNRKDVPEGWCWATLNDLAVKIVDGTHHTPTYVGEGVPFISVKDIRDGRINFEDTRLISAEEHDELSKRCNPEFGDVLITKSGTIGRTALVATNVPFSLFVSVALIKPVKGIFDPRYLMLTLDAYIQSIDISQDVKGGLLKNLHLEDLRLISVQLPPAAEQARIVAEVDRHLSVIREVEAEVDTNLQRAQALRQSTLSEAFATV